MARRTEHVTRVVRRSLRGLGWNLEEDAPGVFFVDFGPPHVPAADALAVVVEEQEHVVLYVNLGVVAPPRRRDEAARFITRANWGLLAGNFELDYDDGHVRFKASLDYRRVELTEALVQNLVAAALDAFEAYGEALVDVCTRGASADRAIRRAEGARYAAAR